jgi:integrase
MTAELSYGRTSLIAAIAFSKASENGKLSPNSDTAPFDWVFASPHKKGRQPYWPGTLWRYYGRPAVKRAAVDKHISYHTFGTLLNANGENTKVVQELLRHANMKVTTDVYMQAVSPQKRAEQTGQDGPQKSGLSGLSGPYWTITPFGMLASPTGFEPVLPP